MTIGERWWVPHPTEIWALAEQCALEGEYKLLQPCDEATTAIPGTVYQCSASSLPNIVSKLADVSGVCAEAVAKKSYSGCIVRCADVRAIEGPDNLVELDEIDEPSILHSLRARYVHNKIYTNVGRIVVAFNPFTEVRNLYNSETRKRYINTSDPFTECAPHIYQTAASALRELGLSGSAQSIIISGESGAGKTETLKLLLQYFASHNRRRGEVRHQVGAKDIRLDGIEERVLRVNPLLEAFGNATTLRNPNSSRFGKWVEVQFDRQLGIIGSRIYTYLLELPRVTSHMYGERGFHVFYQLLSGLQGPLKSLCSRYAITPTSKGGDSEGFKFLEAQVVQSVTQSLSVVDVDYTEGFQQLKNALEVLAFGPNEQDKLFAIVAAILHLGNLEFISASGQSSEAIAVADTQPLAWIANLLSVDKAALTKCLTSRLVTTGKEQIIVSLQVQEAEAMRDSLAKTIYGLTFKWVLTRANATLAKGLNELSSAEQQLAVEQERSSITTRGGCCIGLLDIAGFESFHTNGFEQLCINLANEKFQCNFNQNIFEEELKVYLAEGIVDVKNYVECPDNGAILQLIEGTGGIFDVLDDEMRVVQGSDRNLVQRLTKQFQDHKHFSSDKRNPLKFTIAHYAGAIMYTSSGWLGKNSLAIPPLVRQLVESSKNEVIAAFEWPREAADHCGVVTRQKRETVASSFKKDLASLLETVNCTNVQYIRCIKPNTNFVPSGLNSREVLRQLRCSGTLEVVRLRRAGFAARQSCSQFVARYGLLCGRRKHLLPPDSRSAAEQLLQHCQQTFGLQFDGQYRFGRSLLFLKDSVVQQLEQVRNFAVEENVRRIQAVWRGHAVRKQTQRRVALARELRVLLGAGVDAQKQGGSFLYPKSVVPEVHNVEELCKYVDNFGVIVEEATQLSAVMQPHFLPHAVAVFDKMRQEADFCTLCKGMLQSTSLEKLSQVVEKAKKRQIVNPLVHQVKERLARLQREASLTAKAESAQATKPYLLQSILAEIDAYAAEFDTTGDLSNAIILPALLRARVRLEHALLDGDYSASRPVEGLKQVEEQFIVEPERNDSKPVGGGTVAAAHDGEEVESQHAGSDDDDECENTSSYEDESSVTSGDTSYATEDSKVLKTSNLGDESLTKFLKELQIASSLYDYDRLLFLVDKYDSSGFANMRKPSRSILAARQLLINLRSAEWILAEVKESVVRVVWGTQDDRDVARLANLVKRANALELSGSEIEAARKALAAVQDTYQITAAAEAATSSGVLSLSAFPRLRLNQQSKGLFARVFGAAAQQRRIEATCKHTLGWIRQSLLVLPPAESVVATRLFTYIQAYMGDTGLAVSRDFLADELITFGRDSEILRDEVYCQLMKQLTDNPRQVSVERGWNLLLYCAQNFACSDDLAPYVRHFIFTKVCLLQDETKELAKLTLTEFDQTSKLPGRASRSPRPPMEDRAVTQEDADWEAEILVRLFNDSRQRITIGRETTFGDVRNSISERLGVKPAGWGVMILNSIEGDVLELTSELMDFLSVDLLSQKIIKCTLNALWAFPQYKLLSDDISVWSTWNPVTEKFPTFVFRRQMITATENLYPHPTHANLTYKQACSEFRNYVLPVTMTTLASIIARLLVAERWHPPLRHPAEHYARQMAGSNYAEPLSNLPTRSLAITYALLEERGLLPAIFRTANVDFQNEWVALVRRAYQYLDPHEHQLLAIHNVIVEMRLLRSFGAYVWCAIECSKKIFESLLITSQLKAVYEGTDVNSKPCVLRELLFDEAELMDYLQGQQPLAQENSLDNVVQPLVVTPSELVRMNDEIEADREEKLASLEKGSLKFMEKIRHRIQGRRLRPEQFNGFFESGEGSVADIQFPLWMAFGSTGLRIVPAVSLALSNKIGLKEIFIPTEKIFAAEILWSLQAEQKVWLPIGFALCVEILGQGWALIALVPLSSPAMTIVNTFRAFLPNLSVTGDIPTLEVVGRSQSVVVS